MKERRFKNMKNILEKNSIWICLILALVITYNLGSAFLNKLEIAPGEAQEMGFGICLILFWIFIGSWYVLGWLFDKIIS